MSQVASLSVGHIARKQRKKPHGFAKLTRSVSYQGPLACEKNRTDPNGSVRERFNRRQENGA
ncbi:MAG: hypothetical protein CMM01_12950 [Rhodopirellula sp.]|nr:hypothetical protein [Rhodopirellula sp.]OUX50693.1 MAG: hypothetical protein CBE43_05410 [Rhodopirellula sp. TMED283]